MPKLDGQPVVCDPFSGLVVRFTDNSLKKGDLPGLSSEPWPLELDEDGVPVAWKQLAEEEYDE